MGRKSIGFALLFLLTLVGCATKQEGGVISFQIMIPSEANRGTPFYFIAKPSEMGEFYMNDYQKIANQNLFNHEEEEKVTR